MQRHGYHHGNLRDALIEAALAIVSQEGLHEVALRDVARRAGVSHAALYHHFRDKAALLAAVAEQGFRKMHDEMTAQAALVGEDPWAQLQAIGIGYVRFATRSPSHFRVMFAPEIGTSPELRQAGQATFTLLAEGLGRIGISIEEAKVAAVAAWSLVHGLAMLWIDEQLEAVGLEGATAEELAARCAAMLAASARARPKGSGPAPARLEAAVPRKRRFKGSRG
jgi:AcrR family transcriptional regulator